jgi:hypothetical protein
VKFRTDSTFSGRLGFELRIEGITYNQVQAGSEAVKSPDKDYICGVEITTDGIITYAKMSPEAYLTVLGRSTFPTFPAS